MAPDPDRGRIVLAGSPLGNPADGSERLRSILSDADVVAAEDTRRVRRLARDLKVDLRGRLVSLHDSVEAERAPRLVAQAADGALVVVISDGGMPAVSDPGYRVVRAALAAGVEIGVVPGPSAVTTALVVSGLPVDRFCFEGFLPRKGGERRRRLEALSREERTMVVFESPRRVRATLVELAEVMGRERPAALCRELTKTYEQVRRGTLGDLADDEAPVLGEVTLVIAGGPAPTTIGGPPDWAREVAQAVAAGVDRRSAMSEVAVRHGIRRREVYDAVVADRASDAPEEGVSPQP